MNNKNEKMEATKEANILEAIGIGEALCILDNIDLTKKPKPIETDFIYKLVYATEETEKQTRPLQYAKIEAIKNIVDSLNLSYSYKFNKYYYLINKNDFDNINDFKARQKFNSKGKIQTINLNNIDKAYNGLMFYYLNLKTSKKIELTEAEKKLYTMFIEAYNKAKKAVEAKAEAKAEVANK